MPAAGHGGACCGAEKRRWRYDGESARMEESEGEDGIGFGGYLTSTRNSGDGSRRRGLGSEGDRRRHCELKAAAALGHGWWLGGG